MWQELTPECLAKVQEVFGIFDVDGSHAIDKNEAIVHWKNAFGRISAREFFNTVDADNDGQVTLEEFIEFWKVVKSSGHSEEEILEELENIKNGESWVGFNDLPKKYQKQGSSGAQGQ